MIYLQLFITYFKVGLFGFGGGYPMLSLIQHEVVDQHGWITQQEFTDIVAISQMTPGPIGINSATYIGYTVTNNIFGSAIASIAVCLPSFIIVLAIARIFTTFRSNKYVDDVFRGLRPATVGLIAAAALLLMNPENFIDYKSIIIFGASFILTLFYRVHPILMIILAGISGLLLY
ncbi:MAG: chromate transporter [Dysgonamonadaceae bacterium]|nr:chromate transporter [Dysgonamonadaceae bacterium]